MARPIVSRLVITGTLRATTPLHVGGYGEDVDSDLPLARDGQGQYYVPGTSLAGPIRDWFRRSFGDSVVRAVFGFQEEDEGHASHVVVHDAVVEIPRGTPEVRDGVGIDREYGVAAAGIKYDRAILPRGSSLQLEFEVEIPTEEALVTVTSRAMRAMLGHLVSALESGEILFGAARTRGLGRVKLEDVTIREQVLGSRAGMLAFLAGRANALTIASLLAGAQDISPWRSPYLELIINWRALSPVMVKAGYDGIAVDMLPLLSGDNGEVAPVLPGSSIKGPLRAHAERIVRTVLDHNAEGPVGNRQRFLKQVDEELVRSLFGAAGEKTADGKTADDEGGDDGGEEGAGPMLGRGALSIADCYALLRTSSDNWEAIESADDDVTLRARLNNTAGFKGWAEAYHVAVDRWTGGAADGFLYNVLEPHDVAWEPIVITVELDRLSKDEQLPALALLFLVLHDMGAAKVPLGFGTHRGLGWLALDWIKVSGGGLESIDPSLASLGAASLNGGSLAEMPTDARKVLNEAWQNWISARVKGGAQ